jgi:H+/Cl- antiporter ClcA
MSQRPFTRTRRGRRSRRAIALLTLVVLVAALLMSVAGAALAADVNNTTNNPNVTTSAGLEAPKLDYKFVWWTFILTFGLLVVYYLVILRISDIEFKKIVDAHFGPKREGG